MQVKTFTLGLVVIMASGCATHRLNQFEQFAKAGKKYTEALVVLTEEAGNVAIDADSYLLMKDKDSLSGEDRAKIYLEHTTALKELLAALRKFRKHSDLLKRYFLTLEQLSTLDASSGVEAEIEKLVDRLKKISPCLEESTIGETQVKGFLTDAVSLSVSGFQKKALEKELKKNAEVITKELDLQNAFLSALAVDLEADLLAIIQIKEVAEVIRPYLANKKLPTAWVKKRRDLLSSVVMMGSVDNAKEAAKELKNAFIALVENKVGPQDLNDLYNKINSMFDLIELVRDSADQ